MDRQRYKMEIYSHFARLTSALASPRRLELIDLLAQAPRHVDALAKLTGMSVANASQHLRELRNARLVESSRDGNRMIYRLADDSITDLWLAIRNAADTRFPELSLAREAARPRLDGTPLSLAELRSVVASGEALVLDVRPEDEFRNGHIPGAISIPLEFLEARLPELPKSRPIAVYCRGSFCPLADEAVSMLVREGFRAACVEEGWLEWSAEERAVGDRHHR